MNPSTKIHLGSAGYCALLVGLNWFRSVEYSRQFGVTSESLAPIALAVLLSLTVALYLVYRCVRTALTRLEDRRKIRAGRWIESWAVSSKARPRRPPAVEQCLVLRAGWADPLERWLLAFNAPNLP